MLTNALRGAMIGKGQLAEARAYVGTMEFQRPGIAANEFLGTIARQKEVGAKEAITRSRDIVRHEQTTTLLWLFGGGVACFGLGLVIGAELNAALALEGRDVAPQPVSDGASEEKG